MMFSVWNHAERAYDYYRSPELSSNPSPARPTHLRPTRLGLSPERAAWPLPDDAVWTGRGLSPKGHIAHPRETNGLGALPFDLTAPNLLVVSAVAYGLYRLLRKPRR